MNKKLQLQVNAIDEGTVIDHIPSENLFKVISILDLDKTKNMITFGTNLNSRKMGTKSIIKISHKFFANDDINKISLIAPHAKLNIIKDYIVVEKKSVEVPDEVIGIVKCINPKCITNNETVTTSFKVTNKEPITLKCKYCEKLTHEHQIIIKKSGSED